MPSLLPTLLLALAAVAVLVALRLFFLKPRELPADDRVAFGTDARAALRELLDDPHGAAGREAERRGDWGDALTAYRRALEEVRRESPDDPRTALKRRALESKVEELERMAAG